MNRVLVVLLTVFLSASVFAKPRARDLGVPFDGEPGPLNAITDVKGVEVGQVTLIAGKGVVGETDTVRTGVTAVFPLGKAYQGWVTGGSAQFNANGEMTGLHRLQEAGIFQGPITTTNTMNLGTAHQAACKWMAKNIPITDDTFLPIVGETDDSWVNDLYGFHVEEKDVLEAYQSAKGGPVEEGNVGGGTGNVTFWFKAGMGTASRVLPGGYTVGVLVQTNFGHRGEMKIAGVEIGKIMRTELLPEDPTLPSAPSANKPPVPAKDHSIVVTIATDAPLSARQLTRLASRAAFGLARVGSLSRDSSGEFFIAFTTRKPQTDTDKHDISATIPLTEIDPFFEAVEQATEESVVNALVAAETMTGINGVRYFAIPPTRLQEILKQAGKLKLPTTRRLP